MEYEIRLSNGKIPLSNMDDLCRNCISGLANYECKIVQCFKDKTRRKQFRKDEKRGVINLCSKESDDLHSSKAFRKKSHSYSLVLSHIDEINTSLTSNIVSPMKRLTHNITTLNAHCLQELYSLVSQESMSKNYRNQLDYIENELKKVPTETAKAFLRILKNNRLLKTELSVFSKMYDTTSSLNKKKHELRKVILAALHVFFQDFNDIKVLVDVQDSNIISYFDYESVVVSFIHLVSNSAKYTCPDSTLKISIMEFESFNQVVIDMVSMKIEPDELNYIYNEGFSGKQAKKSGQAGSGIGMFVVKELLRKNSAEIEIFINVNTACNKKIKDISYENNRIIIKFTKYLSY